MTLWFLALLMLLGGCSGNQIPLFNYNTWWGGSAPSSVVVKKGDTLYSISRRYDVPLREVIEVNNLRPPYSLKIGQVLRLPTARYHVVAKGDTLYNISKRYNVDMNSLSRTNNIDAPYSLRIGQRLLLPGSVVSKETTSYAAKSSTKTSSWKASAKSTATKKKTTSSSAKSYSTPVKKRSSKFAWPVKGQVISKFGPIAKGRNKIAVPILCFVYFIP